MKALNLLYKKKMFLKSFAACKGPKMTKLPMSAIFGTFFAVFKPFTGTKTLKNHFYLVEEVLSFNLVGHM